MATIIEKYRVYDADSCTDGGVHEFVADLCSLYTFKKVQYLDDTLQEVAIGESTQIRLYITDTLYLRVIFNAPGTSYAGIQINCVNNYIDKKIVGVISSASSSPAISYRLIKSADGSIAVKLQSVGSSETPEDLTNSYLRFILTEFNYIDTQEVSNGLVFFTNSNDKSYYHGSSSYKMTDDQLKYFKIVGDHTESFTTIETLPYNTKVAAVRYMLPTIPITDGFSGYISTKDLIGAIIGQGDLLVNSTKYRQEGYILLRDEEA